MIVRINLIENLIVFITFIFNNISKSINSQNWFMLKFMLMFMLMFMYACGMIFIHIQPISWYAFTRFREYLLSESTVE